MKDSKGRSWMAAFVAAGLLMVCLIAACGTAGDETESELADKQGQEQAEQELEEVEELEREIALEELPEAVRVTIMGAAGTNTILEIEEVRVGDRLTYEAEWLEDGMEVEIEVAPDGELLEREVEAPDDEDDEDDEDDD